MTNKKIFIISFVIGLCLNIGILLSTAKESCDSPTGPEYSICSTQGGFPLKSTVGSTSGDIIYPWSKKDLLVPALDPKFWINAIIWSSVAFCGLRLIRTAKSKYG